MNGNDSTPGQSAAHRHGGNLAAATRRFGVPDGGWVDLSTGINPTAYVFCAPDRESYTRLPGPDLDDALLAAASATYGVGVDCIAAAPGSQALIQWLPRVRPLGTVAILGPTYSEHAAAWWQAGHDVMEVAGLDAVPPMTDVVVCVNPNNPDGRVLPKSELLALADGLAARRGLLVVDEAFADPFPEVSLARHVDRPGLCLLRSLGKFYGLAGLRLGFALAAPNLVEAIRTALGPWSMAGPSMMIGTQVLNDATWRESMIAELPKQADRLKVLLTHAGCEVIGDAVLFVLVRHGHAPALFEHLAKAGILTRPFSHDPALLRFGLPGEESQWERLAQALSDWDR